MCLPFSDNFSVQNTDKRGKEGIQAQTLSVFHHAAEANLTLLPVINKVDLPHASPETTSEQIAVSLNLPKEGHMMISAKSGLGVDLVLNNIIEQLPGPSKWDGDDGKLRGLVFDTLCVNFSLKNSSDERLL